MNNFEQHQIYYPKNVISFSIWLGKRLTPRKKVQQRFYFKELKMKNGETAYKYIAWSKNKGHSCQKSWQIDQGVWALTMWQTDRGNAEQRTLDIRPLFARPVYASWVPWFDIGVYNMPTTTIRRVKSTCCQCYFLAFRALQFYLKQSVFLTVNITKSWSCCQFMITVNTGVKAHIVTLEKFVFIAVDVFLTSYLVKILHMTE